MESRAVNTIFTFKDYTIDKKSNSFKFIYSLDKFDEQFTFIEELVFPKKIQWSKVDKKALDAAVKSLHLILGISYWKTFCPKRIEIADYSLTPEQAKFWDKVYKLGLGEFFYQNRIDFRGLINFPVSARRPRTTHYKLHTSNKSLLLFGGGKDSLVSLELLKKHKFNFTPLIVVPTARLKLAKKIAPPKSMIVLRQLDPQLTALNTRKDVYNGHVPVSAVFAFVGELTAILYGLRYVIASNERSSNYGNVKYLGEEANHQWSKSIEFERIMQNYASKYINPGITYFSLLRSLYEIKIAEIFSKYTKYLRKFSSCNRAIKIWEQTGKLNWCGVCPKCAFVFTILIPFVSKNKLVSIFGKNLLADRTLVPLYKELLGISRFKPFECVGAPEEVKFALHKAVESGHYANDAVIKALLKEPRFLKPLSKIQEKEITGVSSEHLRPYEFKRIKEI
ncbi:MAG: hypothetical protein HYS87_00205 [Candidatus Colwellbacteria bacterium]|nr:hypothetical protein [Candidatus Colwellbacteria bacterium]